MPHPLDRPAWNALTTRQSHLALGDGRAVRFAPDYGLFAAAADGTDESQSALATMIPSEGGLGLVEADAPPLPPGTRILFEDVLNQMTAAQINAPPPNAAITVLNDDDGPQMLALATLTQPGPFFSRTHQLGDFVGIRQGDQLVAMAGERMKVASESHGGFTEVSGVCTHPDFRGHGHARVLLACVAMAILARGETPFLHVYAHNTGAIALYEALGFRLRRALNLRVLARS